MVLSVGCRDHLSMQLCMQKVLALDGEDSPYLTENCLLKDTDTPVAKQVQKLFVLDKNNMASPESAESE